MSTPVVQGRTTSPGGGETQTATPRILAAEPEQRRRKDPGKAERGEEQRKAEEARTSVQEERRAGGGTLGDDDWVRTDTPERWGPRGDQDEPVADDWDDWVAEQQRQADAALVSAVGALALQQTTSRALIHDLSGKTAPHESRASPIREPEKESSEDEWREGSEWAAEEQRRTLAGDVLWRERGKVSGRGAAEVRQGGPMWKLEEDLLNRLDGGRDWRRRPRSDWPPKHARRGAMPNGRVFFSATDDPGLTETDRWQPGRCIAEKDWGQVRDRPNTRVLRRGDTVAVTEVGNPGLHRDSWRLPESSITRYFVATVLEVDVKQRYHWNHECNGLLLDEGAGYHVHREHCWVREILREDGTTWELDPSPMDWETTSETKQGDSRSTDLNAIGVLPVRRTARRTTITSWEVGSNIAPQHRYLVQEAYDETRRYGPGEEVAIITEQPHLQYRIAVVRRGTSLIDDEGLSGSRLELQQGIGQPSTWVPHGEIRQLHTQCSRTPGEIIGPGDMLHIRSHRPRTSMHWERSLVAVPFIWAGGQQGFRYAKVCAKDAATEASSKGFYQLDGGAHNPKMLRERGSFYAIDRHSPPRASLPEEDIQEVPGRDGARTQEEWTVLAQEQGTGPWSKPVNTDP